jgi:hypothetical protein
MKSQDALDHVGGFKRMSRSGRQAYAIKKQAEEERENNANYYKTKRLASKFEDTVRRQRREAGLE